MRPRTATTLLAAALLAGASSAVAVEMNPHLQPLAHLVGKTWRGTVSPPGSAKPATDVSRFELVLNGQAVRNRHSIDDGAYGGETFILWDEARQSLVYYYFTTAGFYTTGTITVKDGVMESHELVKGSAGGVTDGRETYYVEDPAAVVRFKE